MTWVRLDDNYDTHSKVLALRTDDRRWTWTRILLYTGRQHSDIVPREIAEIVPKAKPAFMRDCVDIGLIDIDNDGVMHVHDWFLFSSASVEEKVAWYLDANPDASANMVVRAVGGTKQRVLNAVRAYHQNGSANGSESGSAEPPEAVRKVVHAHARPVPSRIKPSGTATVTETTRTPAADKAGSGDGHGLDLSNVTKEMR